MTLQALHKCHPFFGYYRHPPGSHLVHVRRGADTVTEVLGCGSAGDYVCASLEQ